MSVQKKEPPTAMVQRKIINYSSWTLTLQIPRHRNGKFSTELFTRYQRSEQALVLAMIEMVINSVFTRKVEQITQEL